METKKFKGIWLGILAMTALGLVGCNDNEKEPTDESNAKVSSSISSSIDSKTTDLAEVELVNDEMKWRYYDGDEDPNAGTWYEGWNKRNGWAYPEGWLDWGTIPMNFSEEDWSTYEGTIFSTDPETDGQVLETKDGKAKSTYFLRHTFRLTQKQVENIYALEITARYNDAMTMYINGSPVGGFHNIPTANYAENLEYGAQEKVADGEFIEETFVVDDVSSLANGFVPGEYKEVLDEENDMMTHELQEPTTDEDGNTFMDITIAVELHAYDPEDNEASFELLGITLNPEESELAASSPKIKNVAVNTGTDEGKMNFTWNALSDAPGQIQVVEGTDKNAFAESDATVYDADVTELAYTKFTSTDYYANKATIDVERGKNYLYRVGNEDGYSEVYPLETKANVDKGYDALFLSDAQIGTGTIPTDVFGWEQTLKNAFNTAPDTSLILNAGDFVDSPDKESEYDAYFTPEILASYPTATAVGNHDVASNYRNHFNEPNLSSYGEDDAGSDYYFTYGNVLYFVLNTNNTNNEEHVKFLEEASKETADQDVDWKVVMFHQSIYAAGKQALNEDVPDRRDALVPVIDELGIDVVFMGHDHTYARTHQMYDFEKVNDVEFEDEDKTVAINPEGTLYLTSSSASGSKYYDFEEVNDKYLAAKEQFYVPTFSHIQFTEDTFTMSAYRTDTMEKFDSYTIKK